MKGSIDVGDFVIDISVDGKVNGVEILNASDVLKNLGINNPKRFLDKVKNVSFRAVYKPDSVTIYFYCSSHQI